MSKLPYNRAFIKNNQFSAPFLKEILDNTGSEETEYWIIDSKESFHGHHDDKFFYFKDSRIETGTKLPLEHVELEFTQEELESSDG